MVEVKSICKNSASECTSAYEAAAPLSVMIVCLSIRYGGVDVRLRQTAQELERLGIRYCVVVVAGSVLHQTLLDAQVTCHPVYLRRSDPRVVLKLLTLAKQTNTTIVDAHNTQSQFWSAIVAVLARIKGRVATTHSVYRDDHQEWFKWRAHEAVLKLCRLLNFEFIAVSNSVARYLEQDLRVPEKRVHLSLNGIEKLQETPKAISIRKEAGWQENDTVLGMIGRLDFRKGHKLAIEALHSLIQDGRSDLRLFVAGVGPEETFLSELVARLGLESHVHFAGFRNDVPNILESIDLFLLTSFSEGLPYSVMEAARQGVPTLASKIEGIENIFAEGESIFYFPPGDVEALKVRMVELVRDKGMLSKVGAAAQLKVNNEMTVRPMVATVVNVYHRVIGDRLRQSRNT